MASIRNTLQDSVSGVPQSVKTPLNISWVLFLLLLLISTIYFFLSQPQIPLNYTVARQEDQLVHKSFLFMFPAVSLTINIVHSLLIRVLKQYSNVLIKLFAGTTLGLQVLLAIAFIRIVLITI